MPEPSARSATDTQAAPASRRRARDKVLTEAVDLAREAAELSARPGEVGEHLGAVAEGERLVTHYFSCLQPGYRGWRHAVTLARAPRQKSVTVCEVDVVAGEDSLLAPPWVAWKDRVEPGDIGREDVLPYVADDPRLDQGYEGGEDPDRRLIEELGLGRPRVLSVAGRDQAAQRWYHSEHGPVAIGKSGATCSSCGFIIKMSGALRMAFGVCANEWSVDDGHVVSLDHGCGSHSETGPASYQSEWPVTAPRINEFDLEVIDRESIGG